MSEDKNDVSIDVGLSNISELKDSKNKSKNKILESLNRFIEIIEEG